VGLKIDCDDDAPIPRPTTLTLECDAVSGFFCRGVATFAEDGYIESMAAAKAAGWLETQRNGVRAFLCPDCRD
jgi:hypothetical protein